RLPLRPRRHHRDAAGHRHGRRHHPVHLVHHATGASFVTAETSNPTPAAPPAPAPPRRSAKPRPERRDHSSTGMRIFRYAALLVFVLLFLMPIYVVVVTSFKAPDEVSVPGMWDL